MREDRGYYVRCWATPDERAKLDQEGDEVQKKSVGGRQNNSCIACRDHNDTNSTDGDKALWKCSMSDRNPPMQRDISEHWLITEG